ncbi:putative ATP-dependent permease ADP1 KNAG_0I00530 [Huiozyma naganishii CBS 8797]|uniref:ABC transporter domain-containing protein n=1 Tax=Huiozyma naganishii (strain ATCC MYA-139 / BCRC 22969 / CBS 8797 / KCTC 17520 / NBRC 10181 / NCYC 3082 / Yp74L-3) TaxID=1071383 RepID=J7S905_HUIN7|nr:hypothetical protein KNAG_0I00530 [Kazachstania naganishii CBS 8797]CCK71844.1 hypothetical protein KNAG_0I00530 [Kazachstania naganishii CBS 8797]
MRNRFMVRWALHLVVLCSTVLVKSVLAQDFDIFDISRRINGIYAAELEKQLSFLTVQEGPVSKQDGDKCPPCFNCMLPIFECKQFSTCNEYNGRCECIDGFAGDDCSAPLCGALSDGNDKRPLRNDTTNRCDCEDGWGGINCNICELDSVCDAFMPDPTVSGTCYKQGMIVNKLYQGCDVVNEKILEVLKGKIPQVTFSCDKAGGECNFQFWIERVESFYCGLDNCTFEYDLATNTSHYTCADARCQCIPGTMLCGANGSIDIGEFLTETVRGPGDFTCDLDNRECKFNEPAMDDLISTVFGDPCIELKCESGECLHYSEIPGYNPPDAGNGYMSWEAKVALTLTSLSLLGLVTAAIFYISNSPFFKNGSLYSTSGSDNSGDDGENFLRAQVLTTLSFENISYDVPGAKDSKIEEKVLNSITGMVKPGQMLAIMGGSGAGKTTLLDILAMKRKTGRVQGTIAVNGHSILNKLYSKMIGFVDQDDFLLPTLTVYETVLNSALLRLPRSMPFTAKRKRVNRVLEELRIMDIKDRIIGNDFERGISGGEKRRVSIACELVTSPAILFLDEPTSGLDANNANNVIECLVRLAKNYNRTLVLSIHQPRSNIFNLFDKLVLLSDGEMIYSGDAIRVNEFLLNNGYKCPTNYNIADYLIDITFDSTNKLKAKKRKAGGEEGHTLSNMLSPDGNSDSGIQNEWEHYAVHRDEIRSLLADDELAMGDSEDAANMLQVQKLHESFRDGPYFGELMQEIKLVQDSQGDHMTLIPKSSKPATFLQQLSILCSRTFKNIYRNPKLLMANYLLTALLSLFLGVLYYHVSNDISGFQNRMGLFFFILTYFGFVTFTGLSSFSVERIIFLKERSNNYYGPAAYYLSKIICDILPLRVIPPVLMVMIVYPLVQLNYTAGAFYKCILILILFNVGVSLEILTIGIVFEDLNNSIILSVLVLLGSLLFSGLFINTHDITNAAFRYLKNFSIFYYSYESLLINEVKTLMLREKKYGLNIEVPGATILSTFGFLTQNMVFDIRVLVAFNIFFAVVGYLALKFIVIERK